ncbi:hypothetical protein KEM60_03162 [Austwickia sp. TVS 96-490-7B]|uniref:type II secretion system F family protein n=1 Tax=Austwickia sp. TVS 96-490-7B TaxID=2830843 RepID=UPI001C5960D3|nr:type II secretion system F family protein [Austwickia sp. TVS 96-490-7B]MBW3086933.1 hypothetical protein [Austwickia sp. TVS 96-490-7B]
MSGLAIAGGLCGAMFAVGVCWSVLRLPWSRRVPLIDRVEPYVRDAAPPSALLSGARRDQSSLGEIVAPWVLWAAGRIDAVVGGAVSVARRQQRAGVLVDVPAFRAEQVVWGAAGACAGVIVGGLAWMRQPGAVVLPVLAVLMGMAGGIVARDHQLTRRVARRESTMVAEFPTVAELLALSISAGEGTAAALERVCRLSSGELSRELHTALSDARAGANLPAALRGLADRTGLAALARFVDGVVIALERGTPLAEVLRAQAQDAREEARRHVMESAGRKEIAMLVPVVFLVLPVTIVFAVYPGVVLLQLSP